MNDDDLALYILCGVAAMIVGMTLFGGGWLIYNTHSKRSVYDNKIEELTPLAEAGDTDAQLNLGVVYYNGSGISFTSRCDKAFEWTKLAADNGNATAQNTLGYLYRTGCGVSRDLTKGFEWTKTSAENGDSGGQNNLGMLYSDNNKFLFLHDKVLAHMWFSLSTKQGEDHYGDKRLQSQENLDRLIEFMTPAEISLAKEKARICLSQNYRNCG